MKSRRQFLTQTAVGLGAIGILVTGRVQAQALVSETDPQATSLGYKVDTTKVDKKKYPKHVAEQKCLNCTLYQAKSADSGGCAIFPGKQVAANGWCSAYQKKA
jgi:hypothetical protein